MAGGKWHAGMKVVRMVQVCPGSQDNYEYGGFLRMLSIGDWTARAGCTEDILHTERLCAFMHDVCMYVYVPGMRVSQPAVVCCFICAILMLTLTNHHMPRERWKTIQTHHGFNAVVEILSTIPLSTQFVPSLWLKLYREQ